MSPTCTPASARAALLRQTRHQNDRAEAGSPGLGTSIQSAPFQWIANVRYPESTPLFLWYPTDPISSAACAFIPKTLLKVVRSVDDLPGSALGVRWSGSDGYRQKSDKGGKLYIILAAPSAIDIRLSYGPARSVWLINTLTDPPRRLEVITSGKPSPLRSTATSRAGS